MFLLMTKLAADQQNIQKAGTRETDYLQLIIENINLLKFRSGFFFYFI